MIGTLALASMLVTLAPGSVNHKFVYEAGSDYKSVSVAGTFNGWDMNANPMKADAGGRRWSATIQLPPGRHQYKFVIDGSNWITDPKSWKDEPDGNGNTNSVLLLVPEDFKQAASPRDGRLTRSVLEHRQEIPFLNWDRGSLEVRLKVRPGDAASVSVVTPKHKVKMTKLRGDEISETYTVRIPWSRSGNLQYGFEFSDGKPLFFGPKGVTTSPANLFTLKPSEFQPMSVPDWVENTVFYQIFPDRFANGSPKNDPKELQPWDAEPNYWNRYGGDAAGVKQHIPYLKALGVNGVYFNPVMAAPSNHRYDPVDFYRIDPEFGNNQEFIRLTQELQKAGIRTVLDQIFDHVGVTFAPFADVVHFQEKSRYRDWFYIKQFPIAVKQNPNYECWWGAESMPKVRVLHPEVKSYLLESVDYWMKSAALSGWRLDVANEVPVQFWREFRKRVKSHDPNAWIVGEVWGDATKWLGGDQWDASMNYPFRHAVLNWVGKGNGSASQFVQNLMDVYGLYVPQVSRNQLNLISSHDTPRFLTEAGNNRDLQKLAAVVQFTFPGAPSIYYGEEIGMEGGADPQNRRPMRWDNANLKNDMLAHYRRLIHARTRSTILAAGDPVALPCDDALKLSAFGRRLGAEFAFVVLNRGDQAVNKVMKLAPKGVYIDLLTGKQVLADASGNVRVQLQPLSALVALPSSKANLDIVRGADAASKKPFSMRSNP